MYGKQEFTEKHDKFFICAHRIFLLWLIIAAVTSFAVGIWLAVEFEGVYFLYTFVGWFSCVIIWVFGELLFSLLYDIKMIRNNVKLIRGKMVATKNTFVETAHPAASVSAVAKPVAGNSTVVQSAAAKPVTVKTASSMMTIHCSRRDCSVGLNKMRINNMDKIICNGAQIEFCTGCKYFHGDKPSK